MEAAVGVIAGLFAAMGIFGLAFPGRIMALFGTTDLTLAGRNEVRAVYGGFGLAAASALAWGLLSPRLAPGIFFTLGLALWGMAAGRVISILIDKRADPFPWIFLAGELVMGAILLFANLRTP